VYPAGVNRRLASIALVCCFVSSGCLYQNHLVGTHQIRRRMPELGSSGSAVVVDRSGEELTIEPSDIDTQSRQTVAQLLRGCSEDGSSTTLLRSQCALDQRETLTLERPDFWASTAMWAGAILVGGTVGVLVGLSTAN
jgi:hypothetical protein